MNEVRTEVARYMFEEYLAAHPDFARFMKEKGYDGKFVLKEITEDPFVAFGCLYDKYKDIYEYFDDWILIKAEPAYMDISEIIIQKKGDTHIETSNW